MLCMEWVEHHGDRVGYDDTTMALRIMKYVHHCVFPIVTFVDTPVIFADLRSEEIGQETGDKHVGIEAVASDFNGNRALSSLDAEGCSEKRSLRLGSLPKLLQQTKGDILIKSLTIVLVDVSWKVVHIME
ncbi:hypothetical protein MTR67_027513 [Solanum verrucosum]|uniref:Uncharacterized protein n=1 Tax=Solanum verrucosum TaxID=315347 RepID=A0AAF0R4U4_SOLVR|nr:hypothetical protein MTR67_027513 [Solanum verrucosum]